MGIRFPATAQNILEFPKSRILVIKLLQVTLPLVGVMRALGLLPSRFSQLALYRLFGETVP